jgi:transposase
MSSQFFYGVVNLAKHHISQRAVDDRRKIILHKSVSRAKLLTESQPNHVDTKQSTLD